MFNFKSNQNTAKGNKIFNLPVFSIAIIACYLLITVVFFAYGMSEGPGRVYTPREDSSASGDATPTPTPTPTPTTDPEGNVQNTPMRPAVKAKGIYYNQWFPENNAIERCIEVIETTQLNAIVLDVKEDNGFVTIATENEAFPRTRNLIGDNSDYASMAELVADLKSRGIYTIARVVCFKDNMYTNYFPQNAILNNNGEIWRDNTNVSWLNPHNRDNWEYLAEICRQAALIGFDEIQLDYVRFPLEGRLGDINYGDAAQESTRYQIISEFVAFIRAEMIKYGVRTSADIFGIVAISDRDAGHVGQNMQLLLPNLDFISPMIYPSHFANSSNGVMGNGVGQTVNGILFTHPDTMPYDVIYNSLQHFVRHIERFKEENPGVQTAAIRPFLQHFTAGYLREGYYIPYGPAEIQAQIQAVYDAGFEEWLLWSNVNDYSAEMFE